MFRQAVHHHQAQRLGYSQSMLKGQLGVPEDVHRHQPPGTFKIPNVQDMSCFWGLDIGLLLAPFLNGLMREPTETCPYAIGALNGKVFDGSELELFADPPTRLSPLNSSQSLILTNLYWYKLARISTN
jgi:hypothetical protein